MRCYCRGCSICTFRGLSRQHFSRSDGNNNRISRSRVRSGSDGGNKRNKARRKEAAHSEMCPDASTSKWWKLDCKCYTSYLEQCFYAASSMNDVTGLMSGS